MCLAPPDQILSWTGDLPVWRPTPTTRRATIIVSIVIYTFAPEDADYAGELLRELRDTTRLEPGCLCYDVSRAIDSPHIFVLYEEYVDQAALDTHMASEVFDRLGINGIRKLAKDRIHQKCLPLD